MYLAASKATTASEVKTEAAGEIGDPNLLYDQVWMHVYLSKFMIETLERTNERTDGRTDATNCHL